jgi:VanZ family protein
MPPVKYYKLRLVIGGLYIALVIIMSLVPGSMIPEVDPSEHDVLSHFTAYFIMMIWYARLYSARYYPRLAAIFILLGIGLEYMQGIQGDRDFQIIDMVFNAIGVLSAWLYARFRFAPAMPQ